MKKATKRGVLFVVVFFLLLQWTCFGFAAGENTVVIHDDAQYQYAEECFKEGEYAAAMVEFKRFVHFFPGDDRKEPARFKIGLCHFHLEHYARAAELFQQLSASFSTSKINAKARFMLASTYGRMGKSGSAERVLQNFLAVAETRELKDRICFELAWLSLERAGTMEKGALARAEEWLDRIGDSGKERYNKDRIKTGISEIKAMETKSPAVAGAAAIIPGAGFAYCRRYKDGLVSFLLNTGLIASAAVSFDGGNTALGAVVSFVAAGFYSGNIYGSIAAAHKYNRSKILPGLHRMEKQYRYDPSSHLDLYGSSGKMSSGKKMVLVKIPF
ncbi:MAG: tetratricopeptide repeat protein [Desulfobacteraceae bacterium]